jgi:Tol biopolymer transport system component
MSTLAAILNQEPKPISQLIPGIPRDLEKIISRCLRKAPERRWQAIPDLKVTLDELKEESDSGTLAGAPLVVRSTRRPWVWVGVAMVVLAITIAGWLFRGTVRKPQAALEVVPLTTYTGSEQSPSFSPDGNQVAFSWNGEKQDNFDIYVKLIGSPTPVRLTTDPAGDYSPAFSADGRSIGFVRVSKEHATFIVIPSIGGPERIVANLPESVGSFAWLPDGKWVVTDGLALLSTETGETHSLTSPPSKSSPDFSPAVSPDGHAVVFSRSASVGFFSSDLYLLELAEDLKPKGEPRRLTFLKGSIFGSVWTSSGQEIIFASGFAGSGTSLWKLSVSGNSGPEQLSFSAGEACCPAISRNGNRLAYQRDLFDSNIWRLSLSRPGVAASSPPVRIIASTRLEEAAQYSPDGGRIAFESARSGVQSIWVSDANGSNAVELFSRAEALCGTPRWSPDGQRLAFDSNAEGNFDIYVIRASGGKPIRLTTDSAHDDAPSWSRDGHWIYFASNRTGRPEVWKVPAGGGEAVPVTRNGGGTAFEAPDGKSVYYTKGAIFTATGLWRMSMSGGEESQVLPSVHWGRSFSLINDGIYFIPEPGTDRKSSIQFLSFTTGAVKSVAQVSRPSEGLSVSPDGRFILFSQADEAGSDLMLVENFR